MIELRISDRVLVFISEKNTHNWAINEKDKGIKHRKAFITYLGGDIADLVRVRQTLNAAKVQLRFSKRLPYKYEMKIWGLSWDDTRLLPLTFDQRVEQVKSVFAILSAIAA